MIATPPTLTQARLDAIARAGVRVPAYDRSRLRPRIAHIGVGGFHRAHLALYTDNVASAGGDWGIVGLGLLGQDATITTTLARQDHLYTLIEKGPEDHVAAVIASIIDVVHAPPEDAGAAAALANVIASPRTGILSMTITEAGYGEPAPGGEPTAFDRIAAALSVRRDRGAGPLTILSCDNVPGNGAMTRAAMVAAAARAGESLGGWVEEHCTFPSSMVDRITPVTSDSDRAWLRDTHGFDDGWPVICEPFRQWVLEDDFAAGRPAWEQDGALFTDRVHDWELYKLRLLNAGHSSMAYLAALAGITFVDEALRTAAVRRFLDELLYREALPTLCEITGHPREAYVASVLERFANTGVRDQIARLCLDGSAKFPTFLIPTIASQLAHGGPIGCSATALAGWARYLVTVEPADQAFDPAGAAARHHAARATSDPRAFLDYAAVFPPALRESARFAAAFAESYERIVTDGPLAVMADSRDPSPPASRE